MTRTTALNLLIGGSVLILASALPGAAAEKIVQPKAPEIVNRLSASVEIPFAGEELSKEDRLRIARAHAVTMEMAAELALVHLTAMSAEEAKAAFGTMAAHAQAVHQAEDDFTVAAMDAARLHLNF